MGRACGRAGGRAGACSIPENHKFNTPGTSYIQGKREINSCGQGLGTILAQFSDRLGAI